MPFFREDVDKAEIISSDVAHLRDLFAPWRERHDAWDGMLYPDTDTDLVAERNTAIRPSGSVADRRSKSQYRSTFVRTGTDNLINRLSRADPRLEVKILDQPKAERELGSQLERFGMGLFNELNEYMQNIGMGTSWLRQVYSYATHPGKIIGRIHVRRARGNEAAIDWDLLDPYMCYHSFSRSLRRFAYERVVSLEDALGLIEEHKLRAASGFDIEPRDPEMKSNPKDSVTMTDYWVEEYDYIARDGSLNVWNGLLVDGSLVYWEKMDFDRLPILVSSMNSMGRSYQKPASGGEASADVDKSRPERFIERHAEPWFAPLQQLIAHLNLIKTLETDAVDWKVHPPLITRGDNGTFVIEDKRLGPGVQIPLEPGQFIEFLQTQDRSMEVNSTIIAGIMDELTSKLPLSLLGQVTAASGFHEKIVLNIAEIATSDYIAGASSFLKRGLMEVIHQFKRNPELQVTLEGTAYHGTERGELFHESFSPSQFPDSTVIDVQLAPSLPQDTVSAIQEYQMAIDPQRGGLDVRTAMAQILKVRDPDAVVEKRRRDLVENSQEALELAKLRVMREEVDALYAVAAAEQDPAAALALRKRAMIAEMQYRAFSRRLLGQGAGFQQSPEPGLPAPAQQPPQERGIQNPQVQAAAQGVNLTAAQRGPARNGGPNA